MIKSSFKTLSLIRTRFLESDYDTVRRVYENLTEINNVNDFLVNGSFSISSLSDAEVVGLLDGQILLYDEATGKWVNSAPTLDKTAVVYNNSSFATNRYLDSIRNDFFFGRSHSINVNISTYNNSGVLSTSDKEYIFGEGHKAYQGGLRLLQDPGENIDVKMNFTDVTSEGVSRTATGFPRTEGTLFVAFDPEFAGNKHTTASEIINARWRGLESDKVTESAWKDITFNVVQTDADGYPERFEAEIPEEGISGITLTWMTDLEFTVVPHPDIINDEDVILTAIGYVSKWSTTGGMLTTVSVSNYPLESEYVKPVSSHWAWEHENVVSDLRTEFDETEKGLRYEPLANINLDDIRHLTQYNPITQSDLVVTDRTNVIGAELVVDGNFPNLDNWTHGGWFSFGGKAFAPSAGDPLTQTINGLEVGKAYLLTFILNQARSIEDTYIVSIGSTTFNSVWDSLNPVGETTINEVFIAQSTSELLSFEGYGSEASVGFSSVSIKEVDFGTVSLGTPTVDEHATSKKYVDDNFEPIDAGIQSHIADVTTNPHSTDVENLTDTDVTTQAKVADDFLVWDGISKWINKTKAQLDIASAATLSFYTSVINNNSAHRTTTTGNPHNVLFSDLSDAPTMSDYVDITSAQDIYGFKDFKDDIKTDTIIESIVDQGVTIDGVVLKDDAVTATTFNGVALATGGLATHFLSANGTYAAVSSGGGVTDHTLLDAGSIGTNTHAQIDTHIDSSHAPVDADNTAANETSHVNVVVDASYVHTDNNFTSALKSTYDSAVADLGSFIDVNGGQTINGSLQLVGDFYASTVDGTSAVSGNAITGYAIDGFAGALGAAGRFTNSTGNSAVTKLAEGTDVIVGEYNAIEVFKVDAFGAVTAAGGVDALTSATTVIDVASATAPTIGQVLTATGGTGAEWSTPSGGAGGTINVDTINELTATQGVNIAGALIKDGVFTAVSTQTATTGFTYNNTNFGAIGLDVTVSNTGGTGGKLTNNNGGVERITKIGTEIDFINCKVDSVETFIVRDTGNISTVGGLAAAGSVTAADFNSVALTAVGDAATYLSADGTYKIPSAGANDAASVTLLDTVDYFPTNTVEDALANIGEQINSGNGTVHLGILSGNGGSVNTFIGALAASAYSGVGGSNIAIGYNSASSLSTGTENTIIGPDTSQYLQTGSRNVIIGRKAGPQVSGSATTMSDKLYIHNDQSNTPLIYGEFDTPKVIINGDLEVTGSVVDFPQLVLLDVPKLLIGTATPTVGWTSFDMSTAGGSATTAANAGATKAILRCYVSQIATGTGYAEMYVEKNGLNSTIAGTYDVVAQANPAGGATEGDNASQTNDITINLDSNSDFEYSTYSFNGSSYYRISLVGYYA